MKPTVLLLSLSVSLACSPTPPESAAAETSSPSPQEVSQPGALIMPAGEEALPNHLVSLVREFRGDFDAMVERRVIRALVTPSLTQYFLDGPVQRGVSFEALQHFEKTLNEQLNTGNLKVYVAIVPVTRDQIIPALVAGRADLAAANLTITPARSALVDFSEPFATDIAEVIVTGPSAPPLATLDDLAGKEIHVRRSSSYFESLKRLNDEMSAAGKGIVEIIDADEHLEDEDLLEMVGAGILPMAVVDTHKADFWSQILDDIEVRHDLTVRAGGEIAWAFRKDSPKLAEVVNAFVRENRKGTLMGNILIKRYLKSTKFVEHALAGTGRERFHKVIGLFQKYGEEYDFDHLMLAALGFQESGLDQDVRSHAGAIGIMQLLQSTASDPNVGIPNIEEVEANIHAGTKYLRFLRERYFSDDGMDEIQQTLFSFAAYNAGPARVRGLRQKAEASGLDPDRWFDNVEIIAAREIGRETVQYVSNIFKYYIAYRQSMDISQQAR